MTWWPRKGILNCTNTLNAGPNLARKLPEQPHYRMDTALIPFTGITGLELFERLSSRLRHGLDYLPEIGLYLLSFDVSSELVLLRDVFALSGVPLHLLRFGSTGDFLNACITVGDNFWVPAAAENAG